MANNKRIQIQHWYTTGNTAPSGTGLTNMLLGEIAIATQTGNEAIFIKNNAGSAVTFMTSAQTYDLVEKATSGITTDGAFQMHKEKTASVYSDENYTDANKYGHVLLYNDDLNNKEVKVGVAAGMGHTHGQYQPKGDYLTSVTAGSGLAINGIIENGDVTLELDGDTFSKLNSGVTAYNWGNHANAGYATNTKLNAHTGDTNIHVTKEQKDEWQNAADAINAFLDDNAAISGAVDTLREINEYLTGTGTSVETLLETLDDLTNTVDRNTTLTTQNSNDIVILKQKFEGNGEITVLQNDVQRKIEEIDVSGNLSATTGTTVVGNYKKYTITHTPASTQASEIKATNVNTAITFGSNFNIVNKIAYDANGHVVTGSTQTLTLPNLPTASEKNNGIVKIRSGQLTLAAELLDETKGYLTTAASVAHGHTEYVKFTDLSSNSNSDSIIISCGTY